MVAAWQLHPAFPKKLFGWALYALIPLALVNYFLFFPSQTGSKNGPRPPEDMALPARSAAHSRELHPGKDNGSTRPKAHHRAHCDYSDGKWVHDNHKPLYSGRSCNAIKKNQNCMVNGRPDDGYLYWRWRPSQCELPPFDPVTFLQSIRNKHLAYIGDSMARNQCESLVCMLASASQMNLVYQEGDSEVGEGIRFRRWLFPEYNATVSVFWSTFLMKTMEKLESAGMMHNTVFMDTFDERWDTMLEKLDVVVFSVGHWFLLPSIYREGTNTIGCHYCPELNFTDIGFFGMFRDAIRKTLDHVYMQHPLPSSKAKMKEKLVVVNTFSPAHFEGETHKDGVCLRKEPYKEGQKEIGYTESELRKTVKEEVAAIARRAAAKEGLRFEVLDVTKLAMLRPDGHPGPYMMKNPFGEHNQQTGAHVQNDCVHWCLPGPVDTFNEILSQFL